MAFEKPTLYFNNALRTAQTGDDGTAYAVCSEAVADPDDPFAILGAINRSDDVGLAADLVGCQVVFDETENRYNIVSGGNMEHRVTAQLAPEQSNPGASLIVGSYLYLGGAYATMKVDLVTFQVVATVPYSGFYGIAVDTTGTYLYLNPYYSGGAGEIYKIELASFSYVKTITLEAGADLRGCAAVGSYLYVAKYATPDSKVYRIAADDSVTSAALTGDAYAVCVTGLGAYLYVGLESVATGKIVRVDLSLFLKKDVLTLTAGENNPHRLLCSATTLYIGLDSAMVARASLSTFTETGTALTLTGLGAIHGLALGATYLFASDNSSPAKLQRVTISSFTLFGGAMTLQTGENNTADLAIDGTYLYPALNINAPSKLVRVDHGAWTEDTANVRTLDWGTYRIRNMIEYEGMFYAVIYNASYGKVLKINPADLSVAETLLHSAGVMFFCLAAYGGFLYIGTDETNAKVYKISLSGGVMAEAGVITLTAPKAASMRAYNGFIYVGCIPARVVKIDTSVFLEAGAITVAATAAGGVYGMTISGTDLYAVAYSTPGLVSKVALGTFTETTYITLTAGENTPQSLAADATYLYIGCIGHVARVSLSSFTEYGSALATTPMLKRSLSLNGNAIYMTGNTGSLGVIVADSAAWVVRQNVSLSDGAIPEAGLFYDNAVYVAGGESSGNSSRLFTFRERKYVCFERLQLSDIGQAFTVRAGLSCAQENATLPMIHAADNYLAPRAKGTENTAVYLRAHAPNFVQRGGFESGAFTGWTAGGNWSVVTANKLEGAYSASWDTAADNNLVQSITKTIEKGRTYRCILKAKALTGDANAGVLTVQVKQAGSGTDVYAAITGNAPAITTTAAWIEIDVVPDFTTDNWELRLVPALANKGTATAIIVDEIYFYEKRTVDRMIIDRHNWGGKGTITVNAWRLSPLRSTASADAANKTVIGSFSLDSSAVALQTLTSTVYPVIEIVLPAVAGWTAEMGELYLGDSWQLPYFLKGPLDPRRVNQDGLVDVTYSVENLNPALRLTSIRDLFDRVRQNEALYARWDTDDPMLMESPRADRESPYTPYRVSLSLRLLQRL